MRQMGIGALHRRVSCAISTPPRGGPLAGVPAGEWCNGNTAVFGTVILGSSPSSPANFPRKFNNVKRHRCFAPFGRLENADPHIVRGGWRDRWDPLSFMRKMDWPQRFGEPLWERGFHHLMPLEKRSTAATASSSWCGHVTCCDLSDLALRPSEDRRHRVAAVPRRSWTRGRPSMRMRGAGSRIQFANAAPGNRFRGLCIGCQTGGAWRSRPIGRRSKGSLP
jgi:hypothetical protein